MWIVVDIHFKNIMKKYYIILLILFTSPIYSQNNQVDFKKVITHFKTAEYSDVIEHFDTAGCLLPGKNYKVENANASNIIRHGNTYIRANYLRTTSSTAKLNTINNYINSQGYENVKPFIFNIIPESNKLHKLFPYRCSCNY
jgi:hypothetical protein